MYSVPTQYMYMDMEQQQASRYYMHGKQDVGCHSK